MRKLCLIQFVLLIMGCASMKYKKTVSKVELDRFMGKWYVIAGRFTYFEQGAHNAVENYSWNEKHNRVDINFTYNKDSLKGEEKNITQKGWIKIKKTNAYWEVSPLWPFKFDYLVIDLDKDYQWTVVGVPSQKYVWIMARNWKMDSKKLDEIIDRIQSKGYDIKNIKRVPHAWNI